MGLLGKIVKKATNTVATDIKRSDTHTEQANQTSETLECRGFHALREEGMLKTLRLDKDFDLSTQDLIEKGYAGKKVYRFQPTYKYGIKLVPEPKNEYDKNAVMITLNGTKIGYIPREDAPRIKTLLKQGKIKSVTFRVTGGPMRKIFEDGTSMANCYEYDPKITITYF